MYAKRMLKITKIAFFGLLFVLWNCASYHAKSVQYQTEIENGLVDKAYKTLESNKFLHKKRNHLLLLLEKGKIAHEKGDYTESNLLFNEADLLIEDSQKKIGDQVLGIITNQENTVYKAEDFEKVAIHYYKSLNYIFLNQLDEALVEAKRINLQLQKINDAYPEGKKNRYTSDAFALNLQGILFEATGNINDAFISYRNAVDLYLNEGGQYFGISIPEQLKKDLLRTALKLGFENEKNRYSELLKYTYIPEGKKNGELIVFWENGTVPYKDQTFYSFSVLPGAQSGLFYIANKDLGLNFQIPINPNNNRGSFADLDIFNVSFPKYVARNPYYKEAKIVVDSTKTYAFEPVQNFNDIAFKTLKDRTFREIGQIALRLAVKKTSEYSLKNQHKELGTLLGLFNALTERSDTRNWQTLPNTISYARIPLTKENTEVQLIIGSKTDQQTVKTIQLNSPKGIQFTSISTPKNN